VTANHLRTVARYLYLWDRFAQSRQALKPIFDAYDKLRIVDDTFLYLRGLPSYGVTYGAYATCAILERRPDLARTAIDHARKHLHDYGFDRVREELEANLSGDWSAVMEADRPWLEDPMRAHMTGMPVTRRAAAEARAAPDLARALRAIDAVTIGPKDHQWLKDVLLLLRAAALHRFGDLAGEEPLVADFMGHQPLLFEPEHAFWFGFIEYQEVLKPRYRATRG